MNEELTFYEEWLMLEKAQFRILTMLVQNDGEFNGNLSKLCEILGLSVQQRNRNNIKKAIEALSQGKYIKAVKNGNTYHLKLIPKENKIKLSSEWVRRIKEENYVVESVSDSAVLKVLLWLVKYSVNESVITNGKVAAALGISESTVCAAKNVLEKHFEALKKRYVSEKVSEDVYIRLGQIINLSAWWS